MKQRKYSDPESETTCSSERNDSLQTVIQNDYVRYERKGYGLFFAIVITILYFYFGQEIMYKLWTKLDGVNNQVLHIAINSVWPSTFYLIGNVLMYVIYTSKIPFFERYRVNNKLWPWEEDPQQWKIQFKKCIKQIAFNIYCVQQPIIFIDVLVLGTKCRYDLESFPSKLEIIWQIIFMMVVEDFTFYCSHRILHTPYLYQKLHKIHHQFNNTVSIGAIYAHPVEYIFGNVFPVIYGFLILGNKIHYATFLIWQVLRVFETIDGHCGYEFSWSPYRLIPFSGSSEYHNFHHSHNSGVYASFFTFWDTIFGTNKDYFKFKAKKEREENLNKLRTQYKNNEVKIN